MHALGRAISTAYSVPSGRAQRYARWIVTSARLHHIPDTVLAALIMTESTYRASARSGVGAVGPAQVRPAYWQDECQVDLSKPADNIWCAGKILARYKRWCGGDIRCAIQAYNVGPANMRSSRFAAARRRYLARLNGYRQGLQVALVTP